MATGPSICNYSQNLIPIFEGDSYDCWSVQMKTLFMSDDLWEIVEEGYMAPANQEELAKLTADQLQKYKRDKKKDARALLFIQRGVSKTIFPRIVNAVTSKEAWEILKTEFQDSERIINNQEIRDFVLMDSLYSAAADGDISKFEPHSNDLIQILTPNDNTILHIHITARHPPGSRNSQNMAFVTYVFEKCPELLWKANKKGETLLHMAARHGHADVAKHLLEECKKPYQNDQELAIKATREMLQMINEAKDTALHEAVRYNQIDVVRLLTDEDRELPYDSNNAGETPLYLAAERGYAEILKKILDTCISPADHGPNSRTALHATVIRNDIEMTELLLDNGRIQKNDKIGWTPLHIAATCANVEILKKLLKEDRSVAYKVDKEGCTALHFAAYRGRVDIMQELISICPGCCELVDNKGQNVLHYATQSKNRNAVRLVLRNPFFGNLINEKDEKGNTPFLQAVSMLSLINHHKVDRLVFNNDNDNAVNIRAKDDSPTPWKWHEIIRWFLIGEEIHRGCRIMSNDDYGEGKGNKINPAVSSKSKDGDENGNGRNSRDDAEKNARQNNELVVATLIATVTFAAGFTVPGGYISEKGLDEGAAILTRNTAFKVFVLLNSMSMFLSSLAVFTHLFRWHYLEAHKTWSRKMRLRRFLIGFAMLAMIGAFLSGTCAVLYRDKNLAINACLVPVAVLAFLILANLVEPLLYRFLRLTNRKSLYNLVCVLDELWFEISLGGFKNLIRNKVCSK